MCPAVCTGAGQRMRNHENQRYCELYPSRIRGGAYGLRLGGVEAPPGQLIEAPPHWPPIELRLSVAPNAPEGREYVNGDSAKLAIRSGGTVVIQRTPERATFVMRTTPTPSALVHPHLASVAAVSSYWNGRESLHAGAFVADGGVWGLLGDKGAGKSSMLAMLAQRDTAVVCDDVLVLDKATAFAGPRSIDLRADAARALGLGSSLGVVGDRERWRVPLGPIEPELPFRGWVTLRWAQKETVRELRGSQRLHELLRHVALRVPRREPIALVELSSLPMLELSRPPAWCSTDDVLGRLLATICG